MKEFSIPMVDKQVDDAAFHDKTTKPSQRAQIGQPNPDVLAHAPQLAIEIEDVNSVSVLASADEADWEETLTAEAPQQQNTQHMCLEAVVDARDAGMRLDFVAAQLFNQFSRERIKKWIEQGALQLNHQVVKAKTQLAGGEHLSLNVMLEQETALQPESMDLNIVYEDDDILVINKPIGLVVHPGAGNHTGTLVNGLLHHCSHLSALPRAGLVHRIDKDTSGLLVVAKNLEAQFHLTQQLQNKSVYRIYDAVVIGQLLTGGKIDAPIKRHPQDRLKMAVQAGGKASVTHYKIKERFMAHTLVRVQIETGRTHQIRVHMSHIGHALVGDQTYTGRTRLPKGATPELIAFLQGYKHQALHARQLGLVHPRSQEKMLFEAPWPDDFEQLIEALKLDRAVQVMAMER